jgi:hypothetical protein
MSGGLRRSGTHAGALKHMVAVAIEHNHTMRGVVRTLKRDGYNHYEGGMSAYLAWSRAPQAEGAVRPRKLDLTVDQLRRLDRTLEREIRRLADLRMLILSEIETLSAFGGGAP